MEQLPKQIIIGEKEFVDSIYKFDYHPAFRKVLEDNDCKVCTIQEFKKSYRIMDNTPLRISPNENILFILDPHSNGLYINSTKDDIEQKMCTNKCIAYKEVLISMGAKEIKLVNTSSDELKTSKDWSIGLEGDRKLIKGSIGVENEYMAKNRAELAQTISAKIQFPKVLSIKKINQKMEKYGLSNTQDLIVLRDRIEENGKICNTLESMEISFLCEAEDSSELGVHLQAEYAGMVSFGAKFNKKSKTNRIKRFTQTIEIQF